MSRRSRGLFAAPSPGRPLASEEIQLPINTAIDLHARAIEQDREYRWLSSPLFNLPGMVPGTVPALIAGK